jgi:hypothetical protein
VELSDLSGLEEQSGKANADSVNKKLDFNNYDDSPSEQHNILTNEQKSFQSKKRGSQSLKKLLRRSKDRKRWITKTKKVEVPILNEEIYINGRRLKYYDKLQGSEYSNVKDRLKEGLVSVINDGKKDLGYSILEAHESNREFIPLSAGIKIDDHNNNPNVGTK